MNSLLISKSEISKLWTVEYSFKQRAFHVDTLDRVLKTNQELLSRERDSDYSLIAVCDSHEKCSEFISDLRKEREGVKYPSVRL